MVRKFSTATMIGGSIAVLYFWQKTLRAQKLRYNEKLDEFLRLLTAAESGDLPSRVRLSGLKWTIFARHQSEGIRTRYDALAT